MCMSVLAGADLVSRLTLPTITDRLKMSCRVVFLIGAILTTIMRAIFAETMGRFKPILISAIYGYVRAATVVNQNLTISEYASQDKLSGALSLNMIAKGISVMLIGQLLGKDPPPPYFLFAGIDDTCCFFPRLDQRLHGTLCCLFACSERADDNRHCDMVAGDIV